MAENQMAFTYLLTLPLEYSHPCHGNTEEYTGKAIDGWNEL